jgi:hypothetical protein
MKTFLKVAAISLVAAFLLAFVVGLFTMFAAPAQPTTTYAASPTGPILVAAQPAHDSFWEDMYFYQMFFGGPSYHYWHPFGYGGYISHPYVFHRSYVINRTTVIHHYGVASTPRFGGVAPRAASSYRPSSASPRVYVTRPTAPSFSGRTFGSSTATSSGFSRGFSSSYSTRSFGGSSFSGRSFGRR